MMLLLLFFIVFYGYFIVKITGSTQFFLDSHKERERIELETIGLRFDGSQLEKA